MKKPLPSRSTHRPSHGGTPPLKIGRTSERYLREGHAFSTQDKELGDLSPYQPGDVVELVNAEGHFVAQALIDPNAKVVARVLSMERKPHIGPEQLRQRALDAASRRRGLETHTSAWRLIHGEADGLPGLTVDTYDGQLVAALYTPAALSLATLALDALLESGAFHSAFLKELPRDRRQSEGHIGRWVSKTQGPQTFTIHEYGTRFQVQPFAGLPTGIYLDMRENRRLAAEMLSQKKVLNTFAYTGGFSVACALKGAKTDTLDLSSRALSVAKENFALNGLDPQDHRFLSDDAFDYLSKTSETYDGIILDPPTFSTGKTGAWSPGRIVELNALALRVLRPGGMLITFSNAGLVRESDLLEALWSASIEAHRPIRVQQALQAGPDFPWLPGFPESRHLKGFVVRI